MPVENQLIQQAFVFALDATPRQQRAFASHAGGARFAYNWGLQRIAEALDGSSSPLRGAATSPAPPGGAAPQFLIAPTRGSNARS